MPPATVRAKSRLRSSILKKECSTHSLNLNRTVSFRLPQLFVPRIIRWKWLASAGLCSLLILYIFVAVQPEILADFIIPETYLPLVIIWSVGWFSLTRSVGSIRHGIELSGMMTLALFSRLHQLVIPGLYIFILIGLLLLVEAALLLAKRR